MKEEKTGTLAERIFYNRENFFSISIFETDREQFYAVGYLPYAEKGRRYTLWGNWKTHPKYGEQFAFTSYEEKEPDTEMGLITFLSSGMLRGVGPATARAMVRTFGPDTMDVLKHHPDRLTEVPGIGRVKAEAITESYLEQRELAETMLELRAYDISSLTAMKLYQVYGSEAAARVREDPYQLIEDVFGIGFQKADRIAKSMGIGFDDPKRIRSGILYNLGLSANSGHTYVFRKDFCEQTGALLDVERQKVDDALHLAIVTGYVYADTLQGSEVLYLNRYFEAEQYVAGKLMRLALAQPAPLGTDVLAVIRKVEVDRGMTLSEKQKQAVIASVENGVCVITGGPGTGKTTIIDTIVSILTESGLRTVLAAPTGRAAKRMTQMTGYEASTIHRLLEYYYSENEDYMRFGRTEENPLEADCVIIDEMSMVDILLMEGLVSAISPGTRLILVGDSDQLPPVGAGSVLKDILKSDTIHSVHLTEIFRQARESLIVVNAHLINRGEYPSYNEQGKDFFFLERSREADMLETIKDLCTRRLPNYYEDCDILSDIQVLTPMRKGLLGSVGLNRELQAILNPSAHGKEEKAFGERLFREGDKVMQIKNNYRISWRSMPDLTEGEGVFNGDIGIVQRIDDDAGKLSVLFDEERLVQYEFSQLDELESAFAMTVHKSQGSEFPVIIMPVTRFPPMLATRNLLYTAVTRAKKAVILVGMWNACCAMVDNDRIAERQSGLGVRLRALWDLADEFS